MHNKPSIALLRQYVRGELSPQEMFAIEKAAEADEMLMDILVGLEVEYAQGSNEHALPELQQQIHARAQSSSSGNRSTPIRWTGLAASLLLVCGIGAYFILMPEWIGQDIALNSSTDSNTPIEDAPTPAIVESNPTTSEEETKNSSKNAGSALAYSNVKTSASRREKKSTSARRAALDTIPIQIIPSNTEELVSLSLGNQHNVIAQNHAPAARSSVSARTSNRLSAAQLSSKNQQPVSLEDIKSITTGIIIDSETQRPIAGAMIRDREMNSLVQTDSTGRFVVGSVSEKPILNVQSDGFESVDHVADGAMRIALKRNQKASSNKSLKASNPDDKWTNSRPEMGLMAYRLYVDNLAKASELPSGEVTLIFSINAQGRPVNIRVKNRGEKRRDQEAINIISNGPKWIKKRGNDAETIEWKIRF